MNTIFLIILGIMILVCVSMLITIPDSYALILGYPMEFWDSADIILDGTVISTTKIDSQKLVQHDIKVNQYFKNQKPQQMITAYGPDIYNEKWFYPKFFKQGDRALFYLKKIDDKYMILAHSIAATEKCDPRDMIGLSTLPGEPIGRGGPTLFFDPYQTCNDYLAPAGMIRDSLPPLKQIKAGITYEDVACHNEKQLMLRDNGIPACIKKSNVQSLLNRGWIWVQNQEYLQFKTTLPTILLGVPPKIDDISPLDFSIEVADLVENNSRPTITITNENQEIVWSAQHNNPNTSGRGAFAGSSYNVQYLVKDLPEQVILKPGNYTLSVSLENQKIIKKLQVVSAGSHMINLGTTDTDLIQEQTIILNKGIDDYDSGTSFNPIYKKIILEKNNVITWFNAKQEPVNIQSDENYFNVTIAPREKLSFTYDAIGIYKYHDPINWKRGTIIVSTSNIESSNLHPVGLFQKNHHEIAKIIATSLIPNDKIVKTRLDNNIMSAYVTDEDADIMIPKSLGILNDLENFDGIRYSYGMTKGLVFPKDEQEGLDFAKGFLEKIGYTLDGTEWIDKVNFGNRIEVTIQQKIQGWIIPNHIIRFEFTKDNTEIILGRWYNDASQYEFKLGQDDAKKISQEYMDVEVKSRPSLEKYDYTFESIQEGVRVIIFDDKPFYMVPITYKANADMNYEVGHCGSNQFLTVYVMVEGKTGTPMGWNYPGCE